MAQIKVIPLFGAPAEVVKLAPVVRALARRPLVNARPYAVTRAYAALEPLLALFELEPAQVVHLPGAAAGQADELAAALSRLTPLMQEEGPDWVIVQGDGPLALAGALAGYYAHARVAHVEAGLRTHDKFDPFPQEIHGRLISDLADLRLAPTEKARRNLLHEGAPDEEIVVTGNPVIDALRWAAEQPFAPTGELDLPPDKKLLLVVGYRPENHGPPLASICSALRRLADEYSDEVHIVHELWREPTPGTWEFLQEELGGRANITLLPALSYRRLVYLLKRCTLVLTDSSGLQEEAPGLGKPVLVLRDKTDRQEAVQAGAVVVVGADEGRIVHRVRLLLNDQSSYDRMARAVNPYGDGQAAARIVTAIVEHTTGNVPSRQAPLPFARGF